MRCANCGNPKVKYINGKYECAYCKKTMDYSMPDYLCKEIDGLLVDPQKNAYPIEAKKVRYPALDWNGVDKPKEQKKRTAEDILKETKVTRTPTKVTVKTPQQPVKPKVPNFFRRPPISAPTPAPVKVQKPVVIPKKRCPKCGSEFINGVASGYECRYCGDSFSNLMAEYKAKNIEEMLSDPVKNKAHIEVEEMKYPAIRWDGYSSHKEMKGLSGERRAQKSLDELKKASSGVKNSSVASAVRKQVTTERQMTASVLVSNQNQVAKDIKRIDEMQKRIIDFMIPFMDRLDDQKAVRSLLSDCLPENALEKNLLINAYIEGVCDEISAIKDKNMVLHRVTKKLVDNYGIMQEKAEWAVITWIHLLEN